MSMTNFLTRKRRVLTILLALTGIAITVAYAICLGACSYLKGDVLGFDLKYIGIFYMVIVAILAWFRKNLLCLLMLAFGAGGEIFLVGYQVKSGVYCPYCLAFGATILLAFTLNFERTRKALVTIAVAAGLLFFLLFFSGSVTPVYAAEPVLPAFGKGPIEVRLYTDYFCDPCRGEEGEVMALITELVGKNLIRVIFIDTPIHRETIPYAGYFLAALNARHNLQQAIAARAALFEAGGKMLQGKEAMEAFLKTKGIDIKPFDPAPVFKIFGTYLNEDRINSTPACVIIDARGKQTFIGNVEIPNALRGLQK